MPLVHDLRLIKAEKKRSGSQQRGQQVQKPEAEKTDFFQLNRKSLLDGEVSLEN